MFNSIINRFNIITLSAIKEHSFKGKKSLVWFKISRVTEESETLAGVVISKIGNPVMQSITHDFCSPNKS